MNKIGLGTDYGLIDILPVEATVPKLKDIEKVETGRTGKTPYSANYNGRNH
ncbi:MAG: hypothetical protein ACOC44_06605 [Promethearchaeia archaeon]